MSVSKQYDVVVIGGGAGGMAAALGAYENGAKNVVLIERDVELGGILQQCIHNGFGLHQFKEELSGPAYAERFKKQLEKTSIEIKLDTTVTNITQDKQVHYINSYEGYQIIDAKAIVVAIGCRERNHHQIEIPGKRLAGILTAGTAQRYLNIDGYLVGKKIFILGSGDIGLIMARRMTLEGAEVVGVAELMPYSNGLNRNIVQCLEDFNIPLYLSHTVTNIHGHDRLEGVTISQVDENFQPIKNSEKTFAVDTLLLSVGLIPENHLLREIGVAIHPVTGGAIIDDHYQTSIAGIFTCGNSLHVHDLVDFVSQEGYQAGKFAAKHALLEQNGDQQVAITVQHPIRYSVPSFVTYDDEEYVTIKYRVAQPYEQGKLIIKVDGEVIREMRKIDLLPAKMETIKLKKSLIFEHHQVNELSLELEVN